MNCSAVARDLGMQVEVCDGVKEGDMVVLYPQVDLVEGSKRTVPAISRREPASGVKLDS
jgi:hypothetical protein